MYLQSKTTTDNRASKLQHLQHFVDARRFHKRFNFVSFVSSKMQMEELEFYIDLFAPSNR